MQDMFSGHGSIIALPGIPVLHVWVGLLEENHVFVRWLSSNHYVMSSVHVLFHRPKAYSRVERFITCLIHDTIVSE
jgi:hypothetical protein